MTVTDIELKATSKKRKEILIAWVANIVSSKEVDVLQELGLLDIDVVVRYLLKHGTTSKEK